MPSNVGKAGAYAGDISKGGPSMRGMSSGKKKLETGKFDKGKSAMPTTKTRKSTKLKAAKKLKRGDVEE